jgi:hypothetical protein
MKAGHFSAKIPGQLSAEINNLISDTKWFEDLKERSSIRAIDIQRLEPREGNLKAQNRVLSYSAKFIGHNNRDLIIGDDFRMLPK